MIGSTGFKEVEEKFNHYSRNRDRFIQELSKAWTNPKAPAVAGVIVLLPLVVTFYILYWFFEKINLIPGLEIFNLTPFPILNAVIKTITGLLLLFLLVTAVGRFVRTGTGYRAEQALDRAVERIPLVRFVYSLTKVATDTLLTGTEEFREAVKIEFNGVRVTGFKTGNTAQDGHPIVFVPTSPNITTGFVVEVDPDDIIETDETVEQALKGVLSAGIVNGQDKDREG